MTKNQSRMMQKSGKISGSLINNSNIGSNMNMISSKDQIMFEKGIFDK